MVRQILPAELAERINAGERIYLLDVRHEWEHRIAALPGSVLIPLPELPSRLDEIDAEPGAAVVVYCHHGIRSLSGASILEQAGFTDVASLRGGIDLWSSVVDPTVPKY